VSRFSGFSHDAAAATDALHNEVNSLFIAAATQSACFFCAARRR